MDNKIDFVITWVDNSDPKWREEFEYYSAKETRYINTDMCRYRDWDTLRYWFRGIEKFAPWVNKIYFVTYGHLPKWLNTDNPKLVIVKHENFIPHAYLPTFNSNVIEYFFYQINGLSERFVYFNDDTFLIDYVSPERFFKKGLPCDFGALRIRLPNASYFNSMVFMTVGLINKYFPKKKVVNRNLFKWYNPSYLRASLHNLRLIKWGRLPGFYNHHLPQGYLKKTYDDVWDHCHEDLLRTCSHKFRYYGDISSWIMRYWQLASGNFTPYNVLKYDKVFHLCDKNISESVDCISHQRRKIVCLNDCEMVTDFEDYKERILSAFELILPDKCSFEL